MDVNVGNLGENVRNGAGNAGNLGGNAGNQGGNAEKLGTFHCPTSESKGRFLANNILLASYY